MLLQGVWGNACTRFRTTSSPQTPCHQLHTSLSPTTPQFPLIMSCCFGFSGSSERRPVVSSSPARAGNGIPAGSRFVEFPLSASSSLKIQKGDITEWAVDGVSDAIGLSGVHRQGYPHLDLPDFVVAESLMVNPANERMLGVGGADEAIHGAAGRELKEACYRVPEVRPGVRCPTREARITPGFMLPAAYVIHTVGPIYNVDSNPEASLKSAYKNSLCVAKVNNVQYIAFTALSCGVFRYPLDEAAKIAISTVKEFGGDIKEVHFVLFSDKIYDV